MEREALLEKLMDMLREDQRPLLRQKIEDAVAEQLKADGITGETESEARALRFLQDLDIFASWRGADFMYSRGIAETLRVGEDIFELAYIFKRAMR